MSLLCITCVSTPHPVMKEFAPCAATRRGMRIPRIACRIEYIDSLHYTKNTVQLVDSGLEINGMCLLHSLHGEHPITNLGACRVCLSCQSVTSSHGGRSVTLLKKWPKCQSKLGSSFSHAKKSIAKKHSQTMSETTTRMCTRVTWGCCPWWIHAD